MRIALDAMGGDNAPGEIIAGALDVLDHINDDQLVLVGDESTIREHLGDPGRWQWVAIWPSECLMNPSLPPIT